MLVLHALLQASILWAPGLGQTKPKSYGIESLPPTKSGQPVVKFVGNTVQLTCLLKNDALGAVVPDSWEWRRQTGGSVPSLPLGDMSSITLVSVDDSYSDTYICSANINGHIVEQFIKLLVIEDIKWVDDSTSVGGQVGESITIDCSLSGNGNSLVTIVDGQTNLLFQESRYHLAGDDKLTIDPLTKEDNRREVKCDAIRTLRDEAYLASNTIAKTVTVTVYHKPEFDINKTKFYGIHGKNGSLVCDVVDSNPPVAFFEFYKGDEQLLDDDIYDIEENIEKQKATLEINKLSGSHFDIDYTCRAKNGQAQNDLRLTLSEGNAPGPVQATLDDTGKHSIQWRLETSGDSSELPVTQFRIMYLREALLKNANLISSSKLSLPGIEPDKFWREHASIIHVKNSGGETVFVANGLRRNTFYNFRFSAVNDAGWGESQELRAETKVDTETAAMRESNSASSLICSSLKLYTLHIFITVILFCCYATVF